MREYRVAVNNAEQTEEPQVSHITESRELFDQWWAKAEPFALNRGLYAVGQYRDNTNSNWQTLVEIES